MSEVKIKTEFGYTTEWARQQAMINMVKDPEKRKAVLELLCKQMGSVAKGEMEMRRRYPELYEEENELSSNTSQG